MHFHFAKISVFRGDLKTVGVGKRVEHRMMGVNLRDEMLESEMWPDARP